MPVQSKKVDWGRGIDACILIAIGLVCFEYTQTTSKFAKIHFQFGFLDFPFFVGEILLGSCMVLWLLRRSFTHGPNSKYQWGWLIYILWVCMYAFSGYLQWGPLALRNAALFYYPLCAFLAFYCYHPTFFKRVSIFILMGVFFTIITGGYSKGYFVLTYLLLFIVLVERANVRWVKVVAAGVLIFSGQISCLLKDNRTILLSSLVAVIFILFVLINRFYCFSRPWKYFLLAMSFVVIAVCVIRFSDMNGVRSVLTPQELWSRYKQEKAVILGTEKVIEQKRDIRPHFYIDTPRRNLGRFVVNKSETKCRSLDGAYVNILFRVFIWEDMIKEIWQKKALFGLGFGWPQQSPNLEILHWGYSEWHRDGWITPHNSFLHIIYRAGIFGFGLLIFLFYLIRRIFRIFLRNKSFVGIFLMAIIAYWLTAANFGLILEFPYYAIPFWSVFGMMVAYAKSLEAKQAF